jgi:hypothetical protein
MLKKEGCNQFFQTARCIIDKQGKVPFYHNNGYNATFTTCIKISMKTPLFKMLLSAYSGHYSVDSIATQQRLFSGAFVFHSRNIFFYSYGLTTRRLYLTRSGLGWAVLAAALFTSALLLVHRYFGKRVSIIT